MIKEKTCSRCHSVFQCNAGESGNSCWCNLYPPFFTPDPVVNCLCRHCLHNAVKEKIDEYVKDMTVEKALFQNKAKDLPPSKQLMEEIDYYPEDGKFVFTTWYHLKKGSCCKNGCRHCPYGFDNDYGVINNE